jgi:hypothetical protein
MAFLLGSFTHGLFGGASDALTLVSRRDALRRERQALGDASGAIERAFGTAADTRASTSSNLPNLPELPELPSVAGYERHSSTGLPEDAMSRAELTRYRELRAAGNSASRSEETIAAEAAEARAPGEAAPDPAFMPASERAAYSATRAAVDRLAPTYLPQRPSTN